MPLNIETAYKLKKPELLEKYKVNICMECGCCAYACPAKRRLVHVMKLSKVMLREYQAAKKAEEEKKAAKKEVRAV
jgi:electron transport complex protein RnfC